MSAIFLLLPLALLVLVIMLGFFIWAVRSGQFEDLETPAMRMLFDESSPRKKTTPPSLPNAALSDSDQEDSGAERS